jgi:hypothetical protein
MDDKISIRLKRSPVENYNIISEYFEDRVDSGKLNNNSRINYLNSIKKLNNIVLEIIKARTIQGVHYPSDHKASIKFSDYVFKKLNLKLRKYYND